jgi:hypothetical protein
MLLFILTLFTFQTYFTNRDILNISFVAVLEMASLNNLGLKLAKSLSPSREQCLDISDDGTLQ